MFKVGKKVICKNINGFVHSTPKGIEKGKIYTIEAIGTCICCRMILYLSGVEKTEKNCGYKNKSVGVSASYYAYRFEIVDENWINHLLNNIQSDAEVEEELVSFHKEIYQYL